LFSNSLIINLGYEFSLIYLKKVYLDNLDYEFSLIYLKKVYLDYDVSSIIFVFKFLEYIFDILNKKLYLNYN